MSRIGIIGGTGLYKLGLESSSEVEIDTPFGLPSDTITLGELAGNQVAFLPRHGKDHSILPHEINYRANIYALKTLGVDHLISTCTAGSLKEELHPGHVVIPDQLIDWTRARQSTFFGNGIGAYVDLSEPYCPVQSLTIFKIIHEMGIEVHTGGTYICIEGPQFSTRAESELFADMGSDIIGMTAMPEAKLAREAEMCYTTIAGISDYSVCGMTSSRKDTMQNMHMMIRNLNEILTQIIRRYPSHTDYECSCTSALKGTIITSRSGIPFDTLDRLEAIIGKYRLEEGGSSPHGTILK